MTILGYVIGKFLANTLLSNWLSESIWNQVNGVISLSSLDGFIATGAVFFQEALAIGLSLTIACALAPRSKKVVYIVFTSLVALMIVIFIFLIGILIGTGGTVAGANTIASILGMLTGALFAGFHVWNEMNHDEKDNLSTGARVIAIILGSALTILAGAGIVMLIAGFNKPSAESDSACTIKGNISVTSGEKIYHLPSDKYYAATEIDTSNNEAMFCSEQDAEEAGFRRSKV